MEEPNYHREGQAALPNTQSSDSDDDQMDLEDSDEADGAPRKDDNPNMECGCCTLDFPFEDFVQVPFLTLPLFYSTELQTLKTISKEWKNTKLEAQWVIDTLD
jgi:hypothetical protein